MQCVRCRKGHWHIVWGHAAIVMQIYNYTFATNIKHPKNEIEIRRSEECFGFMCMPHNNHVWMFSTWMNMLIFSHLSINKASYNIRPSVPFHTSSFCDCSVSIWLQSRSQLLPLFSRLCPPLYPPPSLSPSPSFSWWLFCQHVYI